MKKRMLVLLKEPSTFAGVASALGGLSVLSMSTDTWQQIFGAVMTIAGAVAAAMRDRADVDSD